MHGLRRRGLVGCGAAPRNHAHHSNSLTRGELAVESGVVISSFVSNRRTSGRPAPPRRWSVAVANGLRGAGLGNEAFSLAKAYIGSQVLNADLVEQPWILNRRGYWRDLGPNVRKPITARWAARRGVREFDHHDLRDPWDYYLSMQDLADRLPAEFVVKHTSGMKGGYLAIAAARGFLRQRLIPDAYINPAPGQGTKIGVHVRLGDFQRGAITPGAFNVALPISWTIHAVESLLRAAPEQPSILVHTDASANSPEISALMKAFAGYDVRLMNNGLLGDLRSLTQCDVLVPSVSSFSTLALFLSDASYVWPREQLVEQDGWLSIWGAEREVRLGPTAAAIRHLKRSDPALPRGVALAQGDTIDLAHWLEGRHSGAVSEPQSDLILFGAVAATTGSA